MSQEPRADASSALLACTLSLPLALSPAWSGRELQGACAAADAQLLRYNADTGSVLLAYARPRVTGGRIVGALPAVHVTLRADALVFAPRLGARPGDWLRRARGPARALGPRTPPGLAEPGSTAHPAAAAETAAGGLQPPGSGLAPRPAPRPAPPEAALRVLPRAGARPRGRMTVRRGRAALDRASPEGSPPRRPP